MQLVRAKKRVQPLFSVLGLRQFPNHHACDAIPKNGERVVVQIAAEGNGNRPLERLKQALSGKKLPACRPCGANELPL